jgi:hypothetical protein
MPRGHVLPVTLARSKNPSPVSQKKSGLSFVEGGTYSTGLCHVTSLCRIAAALRLQNNTASENTNAGASLTSIVRGPDFYLLDSRMVLLAFFLIPLSVSRRGSPTSSMSCCDSPGSPVRALEGLLDQGLELCRSIHIFIYLWQCKAKEIQGDQG